MKAATHFFLIVLLLVLATNARAALPQQDGVLDLAAPGDGAIKITGVGGSWAGHSVADAGDVNGDGISDVIVGAPQADTPASNAGNAYVLFGPFTSGFNLGNLAGRGFAIQGAEGTDFLGTAVAGIGDMNGDGKDDVAVGASGAAPPTPTPPGAAYVIFGKADTATVNVGSLGEGGFSMTGPENDGLVGRSVAGIPDMNGDGRPEVAVGGTSVDTENGSESGAVWVVYSRGAGAVTLGTLPASQGILLAGPGANAYAGFAVAGLPDVNGDGRGEVVTGAPGAITGRGAAYVTYGQSPGGALTMGSAPGYVLTNVGDSDLGQSLAILDDQNGDSFLDVLVGSRGHKSYLDRPSAGNAWIGFGVGTGPAPNLSSGGGFEIGGVAGTRTGHGGAGLRDVNGTGGGDVAVNARCAGFNGRAHSGSAYVIFRNPANTGIDLAALALGTDGFRIDGPAAQPNCGTVAHESEVVTSRAGDLTSDGRPDMVVGMSRTDDPSTDSGGVWIVRGWGATSFSYPALASVTRGTALAPLEPSGIARTGPFSFSVSPQLPAGLGIDPATGVISGTPTAGAGPVQYTVTMTDLAGTATQKLTLDVVQPVEPVRPVEPVKPVDPCVARPSSCVYPRISAEFTQTALNSRLRTVRLVRLNAAGRRATLRFSCLRCVGSKRQRAITVRPPLTVKKVNRALKRARGVRVTLATTLRVTLIARDTVGWWGKYVARTGAKPRGCIPVGRRSLARKCSAARPKR